MLDESIEAVSGQGHGLGGQQRGTACLAFGLISGPAVGNAVESKTAGTGELHRD
jgi:hypothetical protein